jgi:hypothetical protein
MTLEAYRKRLKAYSIKASGIFMVFDEKKPIGSFSLQMDPPQLLKKYPGYGLILLTGPQSHITIYPISLITLGSYIP